MNINLEPELHQPKTLFKLALNTASKTSLLNVLKHDNERNNFKKIVKFNKRKENTIKHRDKRITIETMLTEIYRLKVLMHDLINVNNNPNFIENIYDNDYDYYFVYYNVKKILQYYEDDLSEDKQTRLNNIIEWFNAFLEEQFNNGDMHFVGMVLAELEEFAHYEDDFTELNDIMANFILPNGDMLFEYFKVAYDNKYSKVLVKLKEFADYLAMIAHERGDKETFIKIKDLYIDQIDNNFPSLETDENELKELGAINIAVRAELLNKTPTIHGGSKENKLHYGTVLVAGIIMCFASMM